MMAPARTRAPSAQRTDSPAQAGQLSRSTGSSCAKAMQRLQRVAGNRAVESLLARDSGEPLPDRQRAEFEPALGVRLGDVRVHRGPDAEDVAERHGARALALGRHVVFGRDQYRTGDPAARGLLAHELAHVVQSAAPGRSSREQTERQADRIADRATRGEPAGEAPVGADGVLLSPLEETTEVASEEQLVRAFARVRQGVFTRRGRLAELVEEWHRRGLLDPPHLPAGVESFSPVPEPGDIPYVDRTRADAAGYVSRLLGGNEAPAAAMMGALNPGLGGRPPLWPPPLWPPAETPRVPPVRTPSPTVVEPPSGTPRPPTGVRPTGRGPGGGWGLAVGIPLAIAAAPVIADSLGRTFSPEDYPPNWEAMTNPITGGPIEHLEDLVWLRSLSEAQIAYLRKLYATTVPVLLPGETESRPGELSLPGDNQSRPGAFRLPGDNQSRPGNLSLPGDNQSRPGELRLPGENESAWEVRMAAGNDVRWRGRVRNLQSVPAVQAGHRTSAFRIRETGELDRLAIEDADFNQWASNMMEAGGIHAVRESIEIQGVIIDRATARMYSRDPEFPRLTSEMVRDAPAHPGWERPPDMTPERAKSAFMEEMLEIIASDPDHPLAPLLTHSE